MGGLIVGFFFSFLQDNEEEITSFALSPDDEVRVCFVFFCAALSGLSLKPVNSRGCSAWKGPTAPEITADPPRCFPLSALLTSSQTEEC